MQTRELAASDPPAAAACRLADRVLRVTLFATTLSGMLVFIEPSPYEAMFAALVVASLAAGVSFDRRALPLLMLSLLWMVGGGFALMPVANSEKAVTYLAISAYLSMTAVLYACLFARDCARRVATMRAA
jgi:hypothetical protein